MVPQVLFKPDTFVQLPWLLIAGRVSLGVLSSLAGCVAAEPARSFHRPAKDRGRMSVRVSVIINALCAALLGWLYGGDAIDALRSQSAEVSAYLEPPSLGFALFALVAVGVGAGATALGVVQRREPAWRGYRLMPIVTVVVLFVDLFVFTGSRSPLTSADRTALAIRSFVEAASTKATSTQVPTNPRELQALADSFGPPAYLVRGVPAKGWTVVVRDNCQGPVTEVKGEPVGTLFYCVAPNRNSAWVSAVALPVSSHFGGPAIFAQGRGAVSGVVGAAPPEEEVPPSEMPVADEEPRQERPDSGR